jgi:alanyl-tRNA synthetase
MIPMTFVMSAGLTQIESEGEYSANHAGERYVLLQPCFRHFDLEKIGRSLIHLSLFGMGGAFSFGETRKRDTIRDVWRFLTDALGFCPAQLGVTYFSGGALDGFDFAEDSETISAWREIGLHPPQMVGLGAEANLWRQGGGLADQERFRKCGPTTEIFFDRGSQWSCGPACRPGCRCGRFIEIANVLFIRARFDQVSRTFEPMVTPFDETVIGVERAAMALQGKASVFELECLAPLVRLVRSYLRRADLPDPSALESAQIIADHIRALLFLAADAAPPPGKGGRAGIIRKLIRAMLTHQKALGIARPTFIPDLVDAALDLLGSQYPHLHAGRAVLLSYFDLERERFEQTLSAGYRRLDQFICRGGNGALGGEQALDLVKRHGLPLILLEAALAQRGVDLSMSAYQEAFMRWEQAEAQTNEVER